MGIDVTDTAHHVYLKTGMYNTEDGLNVNTIPLKVTSISVTVNRSVPNVPVPLSSLVRGEAERVGVDLGFGEKNVELQGYITNQTIRRSHTRVDPDDDDSAVQSIDMTADEIAQLIASSVDSSGLARHQTLGELVFFIQSNIDHNYSERSSPLKIPFTFAARGDAFEKDNKGVPLPSAFPTGSTQAALDKQTGLKGYIDNFNFSLEADAPTDIGFTLSFKIANIFP